MTRRAKPRKPYRARTLHANAVELAILRARKLPPADVARQVATGVHALAEFSRGNDCAAHWRSLADTANVAEQLSEIGIGAGDDALRVVATAQRVLHDVMVRRRAGDSWTLHAAELDALHWLVSLHSVQLRECSQAEFNRAYDATHRRLAQARAGNAPAGAIVIEGEIA